ncbi:tripartite tricarboxylate transporter TctB family protein [Alkalihalobacillus sp. NPDC078783]
MNLTQERLMGITITLVGLLMFLNTLNMSFLMLVDDPGPKLLPQIVSIGLIGCGVGLILYKNESAKKVTFKLNDNSKRMIVSFIALVIYAIVFNFLGYLISTFLFLTFLTWYLTKEKNKTTIIKSLISSTIVTVIIYVVFSTLLNVILPSGFL